jgi:hypothetical protein
LLARVELIVGQGSSLIGAKFDPDDQLNPPTADHPAGMGPGFACFTPRTISRASPELIVRAEWTRVRAR